jgi:actin-related protein
MVLQKFIFIGIIFSMYSITSRCYVLNRSIVLIVDIGYKEAQIFPVAEGVQLAVQFDSLPYASQAILISKN